MKCPRCEGVDLDPLTFLTVELEACNECNGAWLDDRALEHLTAGRGRDHLVQHIIMGQPSKRMCPRCHGQHLSQGHLKAQPHIPIDQCPQCEGLWLDSGELGVVLNTVRA